MLLILDLWMSLILGITGIWNMGKAHVPNKRKLKFAMPDVLLWQPVHDSVW